MSWNRSNPRSKSDNDEVASVPALSDVFMLTRTLLHTMFVFDDVLDPTRLGDALEELARRDGWRKLGSRLRKNAVCDAEHLTGNGL